MNIYEDLSDLYIQATTEKSHYYCRIHERINSPSG